MHYASTNDHSEELMDEKLARGLTRELFRRLSKQSNLETSPTTPALTKLVGTYLVEGGVEEWQLGNIASNLTLALGSHDDVLVSWRKIDHPVKTRFIVESTTPSCVDGTEQGWLVARSDVRVLQRNVLKVIETVHHVAISQHAIFRLFQRGESRDRFIADLLDSATLWTPTLLFTLFGKGATRSATQGTNITLPFADGLLLGDIEINYLEGSEQGPTITDFRRSGHKMRRLQAPFQFDEARIPTVSVNTYISKHELFENQQAIYAGLTEFERRFRGPMENMRRMCALGYPDKEVTKLLGPVQFNQIDADSLVELAGQMHSFFESTEWRQHSEARRPQPRFLQ
jgi:hypothetical protein